VLRRLLLACSCLFLTTPAAAQLPDDDLRQAEDALARALVNRDAAAFDALLAPDFVLRGVPDVPRDTWIANALSLCWGDRHEITDVAVRSATGEMAVVSLVLTTFTDPQTCEPAIIRSLLTDLWRRTPEGWRLALRHSGPAGDAVTGQFARTDPPPPRWERAADLSLVRTGGNTETQTLGVGGSLTWRPGPWTTRARATYVRSTAGDVQQAESFVSELRQARAISDRLDIFGRTEYVVDRFAGIDFRTGLDAGLGLRLIDQASHGLRLDLSSGFSREARRAGEDLTFALANVGGLYRWRLSRTSELTNQALVTADLQDGGNWRFSNGLAVSASVTRLLSFRLSHEIKHINQPVPGFLRTDTIVSGALVARF
jgi:putative salt-induced outer membrane protein YdiY